MKTRPQKCHFMENPYQHLMTIRFTARAHTSIKSNFKLKKIDVTVMNRLIAGNEIFSNAKLGRAVNRQPGFRSRDTYRRP